ncbi:MAG: helix-hairpin-helix domain-containing protein, partial [Candidatus Odinarchaeia archaeon]
KTIYLRRREYEELDLLCDMCKDEFLVEIPNRWEDPTEYEFFLSELKTASLLLDWINEKSEDEITSRYDVGPGDIQRITELAQWLIHSTYEISRLFKFKEHLKPLKILERRINKGVKQELLEIIKLKGIGRKRSRILFNAGFKTFKDLREAKLSELTKLPLIGNEIANSIIKQVKAKESIRMRSDNLEKKPRQKTLKEY